MQKLITEKLNHINEYINNKIDKDIRVSSELGLYNGDFGMLLYLYLYSHYFDEKSSFIDPFLDNLLNDTNELLKEHSFCGGLSGILYLFDYLRENNYIDIDITDIEDDLNGYLNAKLRADIYANHYDFLHGALGAGFYFLKKGKVDPINELLGFLYNSADINERKKTFAWKSNLDIKTNEIGYNIALSHGIASIVIFLAHAIKNGFSNEKTVEVLEGAVNFILSQEIDYSVYGSHFPSQSVKKVGKSRLGWCYGDLGIAYAIYFAGKVVNNNNWINKGIIVLIDSTKRTSLTDNWVQDAGICHGSAGIAMVFRRMYIDTKNEIFLSATNYWIEQTLNFSHFEDGVAGYKFGTGDLISNNLSLLSGVAGVGLALLSYLMEDKQEWDEIFLLS